MSNDEQLSRGKKLVYSLKLGYCKKEYLKSWEQTSDYFATKGYYTWMAKTLSEYIAKPRCILDIGCGTGEGILALLKRFGCQIISLEENEECIDIAAERLTTEGYNVRCVKRLDVDFDKNLYKNRYQENKLDNINFSEQVVIIQSDVLDYRTDIEMLNIIKLIQFDTITCWLIATPDYRFCNDKVISTLLNREYKPADFEFGIRYEMHKIVCELGDALLRNNGIVNCVERLAANEYSSNKDKIDNIYRSLIDDAEKMHFCGTKLLKYIQPSAGISMTNGEQITNITNVEKEFCSFFFEKKTD